MPVTTQVKPQQQAEFGWFEIFVGGEVTDSKGRTEVYDEAKLDQVVRNFKQDHACLVIGHVEKGDPSYGDVCDIKREGLKLYAKAKNVDLDFAQAVANHRYPTRSVRLAENENAELELEHIAFLGGEKPAVKGMARLFQGEPDAGINFDFAAPADETEFVIIQTAGAVSRLLGNIKTWLIGEKGADEAEKIIPQWELNQVIETKAVAEHERYKRRNHNFSAPQAVETDVTTPAPDATPTDDPQPQPEAEEPKKEDEVSAEQLKAAQDALKAAQEKNAQLEYAQRVSDANAFINTQVNEPGKAPRITKTEGFADFMAGLADGDKTFDFAAADGKSTDKVSQVQWFKNMLLSMPTQDHLTKDFNQHDADANDAMDVEAKGQKIADYVAAEDVKGRTISVSTAMSELKTKGEL